MITTSDYPIQYNAMKENMELQLKSIQKGISMMNKAKEVQEQQVSFEKVQNITLVDDYHYSSYEGGVSYIESLEHLLVATDNDLFELVVIGNRTIDGEHVFDVYAPKMDENQKEKLNNKISQRLQDEAYSSAFNTEFSLRFC